MQVLGEVKLEKCADTIVGGTDPIYMKKGLSGGERKRLSIAAELLLAPQLIYLDEPTSGKEGQTDGLSSLRSYSPLTIYPSSPFPSYRP